MNKVISLLMIELKNLVDKSQYFNPFFSWIVVSYTYFSIGLHGGKIWKYLFFCITCALIAIILKAVEAVSKSFEVDHVKFLNLLWFENFFWGLNEWGYMYINFMKIKACISQLNKKFWDVILYSFLIYTIIVRMYITYIEIGEKKEKYSKYKNMKLDQDSNYQGYLNSALYFPLGLICTIFVFLIIKDFLSEKSSDKINILSILLHSTLSRMLFVSLLFIGMSIIVFFPTKDETVDFIRTLLWRIKGILGIIFLVDLLLLRIDLDKNKLLEQTRQLKLVNYNNSYNDLNPTITPMSSPVQQNTNMNMEYTNKLLSKNKSNNDIRKSHPQNKKGIKDNDPSYINTYMVENSDISRNNNFNYSTNYSRKNSRVSNMSNNFRMNTSPPLPYSNFSYDKPSSSNDSINYNVSLPRVTNNANNIGIEATSLSTSTYNSMSRLHSGTISVDNLNPSTQSSNNESLSRSFSQRTPTETYQDLLTVQNNNYMQSTGRMSREPYQGSLYSLPESEVSDQNISLKNRPIGDIVMENIIYEK